MPLQLFPKYCFWLLTAVILPIGALTASAQVPDSDFDASGYTIGACANFQSAATLCDQLPLSPIEGIWEYPADDIRVLIISNRLQKGAYDVYVIDAVDCRLHPGMKIGQASDSADPRQFKLSLCSKIQKGLPGKFIDCLAKLSNKGDALIIQAPKIKFSINPSLVLPVFWNKLRLSLRLKTSNPIEKLPEGWRKVYPSYDGNGSISSSPRYL